MTHNNIIKDYTKSIFSEDNYSTSSEYTDTPSNKKYLQKYDFDSNSDYSDSDADSDSEPVVYSTVINEQSEGVVSDFFDLIIKIFS